MPILVEIETVETFIEDNGGSPLPLPSGDPESPDSTWQILPTGARFEKTGEAFLRHEAPDNEVECLREECRYLKIKRDRLDRESSELQANLQLRAGYYVFSPNAILPDDGALEVLAALMDQLRQTEAELETKQTEYLARRGPSPEDIRREKQEQRRIEATQFLGRMFTVAGRDVVSEGIAQDAADEEFLKTMSATTELVDIATNQNVEKIKEQNRLRAMAQRSK